MSDNLSIFYNDLDASLAHAWTLLSRGSVDRHSPFHTPVVSTIDAQAMPHSRVMVLRKTSVSERYLSFHTDKRAAKVQQVSCNTPLCVLGYDARAKIQLRLSGYGEIHTDGELVDQAWASTNLYGRRCYLASQSPGLPSDVPTSGLDACIEGRKPSEAETQLGRDNFAVLVVHVTSLEWLFLANTGHRRAFFLWENSDVKMQWLVP